MMSTNVAAVHLATYDNTSHVKLADDICNSFLKKGKRKVQGVPQSQTAALPRHQEEEETDKSK